MLYEDDLDLDLLERSSGLPARTIRYYITRGLLSEADQKGRSARYGRGHLERLLLIRELKEAGLSLDEIGLGLKKYGDDGMRKQLVPMRTEREKPPDDALAYARWAQGSVTKEPGRSSRSFPATQPEATWKRTVVSPDVELHVRQPLDSRTQKKVDELVRKAEDIFS